MDLLLKPVELSHQGPILEESAAIKAKAEKKLNWRDFFDVKEIQTIINKEGGWSENEEGKSDEDGEEKGGSDSDPSEGNIDAGEFMDIMESAF